MDMGCCFMAIDESDDMRMVQALENVNLRREIVFQLLVEFRQVDRLDGHIGS